MFAKKTPKTKTNKKTKKTHQTPPTHTTNPQTSFPRNSTLIPPNRKINIPQASVSILISKYTDKKFQVVLK